ncbi:MAG TPA: ATP phosphoribosyltransferase [Clostridiales bacterium]|nr:ATP phosphoribosyltransferase [Clostridiales bacterium]
MSYLTIALAKGRLAERTVELFERAGIDCKALKKPTRKLVLVDEDQGLKFILVKPSDVPTYVEYGAADLGIVGKDTLLEESKPLYEMLDLGFGRCRMVVAGFPRHRTRPITLANKRVATKYPNIAMNYFRAKGETIEVIKLNGSVELGPIVGLSDVIVDIVETGNTLRENGLVVLEEICDISARLVVNRVSLKMESSKINNLITRIDGVLKEEGNDRDY